MAVPTLALGAVPIFSQTVTLPLLPCPVTHITSFLLQAFALEPSAGVEGLFNAAPNEPV